MTGAMIQLGFMKTNLKSFKNIWIITPKTFQDNPLLFHIKIKKKKLIQTVVMKILKDQPKHQHKVYLNHQVEVPKLPK